MGIDSVSHVWISTLCSVSRLARRPPISSGRIAGCRAATIRTSIRVIARPRRCSAQISEAYETLVDPDRRRTYDEGGRTVRARDTRRSSSPVSIFRPERTGRRRRRSRSSLPRSLHPARTADSGRPEPGADIHATITIAFEDVDARRRAPGRRDAAGRVRRVPRRRSDPDAGRTLRAVPGQRQGAVGARAHGVHQELRRVRRAPAASAASAARSASDRAVTSAAKRCRSCVPPGVTEGTRLRIADRGHAGRHGGRNGDLYVTVHVQPHPVFTRQGDDLCTAWSPIGVHDAVLGARVDVPSLEGPVRLRIPPGTQAGQRFRLRERGVPSAARRPRRSPGRSSHRAAAGRGRALARN